MSERELLRRTAEIAADFLESLDQRPAWPPSTVEELRARLGGPLPDAPSDPIAVIEHLAETAGEGVVAIPAGATSASSSAARCRRPWRRTG